MLISLRHKNKADIHRAEIRTSPDLSTKLHENCNQADGLYLLWEPVLLIPECFHFTFHIGNIYWWNLCECAHLNFLCKCDCMILSRYLNMDMPYSCQLCKMFKIDHYSRDPCSLWFQDRLFVLLHMDSYYLSILSTLLQAQAQAQPQVQLQLEVM